MAWVKVSATPWAMAWVEAWVMVWVEVLTPQENVEAL
jgi:hypothetical protein